MKRMMIGMAVIGVWTLGGLAQATLLTTVTNTYTFENLAIGTLTGQDNWVNSAGHDIQVANPSLVYLAQDPSTRAAYIQNNTGTFTTYTGVATRLYDGTFGFPSSPTKAFSLQIDARSWQQSAEFGLGKSGAALPSIFFGYIGTDSFGIQAGSMSASATITRLIQGDWLRIRLDIDPSANGGNGSASLFYQDLTQSDSDFTAVAALQDVNLLWNTDSVPLPDTWNQMRVYLFDYYGGDLSSWMDNLTELSQVPEPGTITLFGLGTLLVWWRRRIAR